MARPHAPPLRQSIRDRTAVATDLEHPSRNAPDWSLARVLGAVLGLSVLVVIALRVGWLLFHGQLGNKAALEAHGNVHPPIQPGNPSQDGRLRHVTGELSESRNTPSPPVTAGKPPTPVPPKPPMEDPEVAGLTFEKHVLPILQARCSLCHNTVKRRGGLDVLSMAALLQGGESGPAVTPGSLEDSYLWEMLETDKMPPKQIKLPPEEKAVIRKWILTGAKDSRGTKVPGKP
jgi:hypothetical protein